MKERPILFSGPMVRALLAGTKTQTRRIAKDVKHPGWGNVYTPGALAREPQHTIDSACPYGQPGDRLWVRETFYAWGRWETRFSAKKSRDEWHFVDMTLECGKAYQYAGDRPQPLAGRRDGSVTPKWWKRPAIHMPRAASRLTLEIAGVRVERLQDISAMDAKAEGIEGQFENGPWRNYQRDGYWFPEGKDIAPILSFRSLWEQINGPDSWYANPWVWVVEFKQIDQPQAAL